jgi:hypothetical protein
MARTPSQDLFDEAFGSDEDRRAHGILMRVDPALEPVDPREVELDYWRFGGLLFFPMLVRLGKGWLVGLEALVMIVLVACVALTMIPAAIGMLLLLIAISLYELGHLDAWSTEHNARVAARRAMARRRRDE